MTNSLFNFSVYSLYIHLERVELTQGKELNSFLWRSKHYKDKGDFLLPPLPHLCMNSKPACLWCPMATRSTSACCLLRVGPQDAPCWARLMCVLEELQSSGDGCCIKKPWECGVCHTSSNGGKIHLPPSWRTLEVPLKKGHLYSISHFPKSFHTQRVGKSRRTVVIHLNNTIIDKW